MGIYRGFWFWGIGIVVVLGSFMIFVAAGWPGSHDVNDCVWGDPTLPAATQKLVLHPPSSSAPRSQQRAYDAALTRISENNSCYCESFSVADAVAGASGYRQGSNTWFNLYSIAT